MKQLVIGILAHVDAGKTTLSESLLYLSGKIGKLGRVDKKDAYLDHYDLERERGITIFSKQAVFDIGGMRVTLLDTPGHVDFSAEMERTLSVLDYAILVVSGADGIQGHTKTLWRLLEAYQIPCFVFINKMDQQGLYKEQLLAHMKAELGDGCVDFTSIEDAGTMEQIAMCEEELLEMYLEKGTFLDTEEPEISLNQSAYNAIKKAIYNRKIFPCFFGSALKLTGVEEFLKGIEDYTVLPSYTEEFGAKVFKITRDEQGARLTHMKITGGALKVRDSLSFAEGEEKVTQIRLYSGTKFESLKEAEAGTICTVTGLAFTKAGEGLGVCEVLGSPILEPVLSYTILLPEGCDPKMMMQKLSEIEEEEPELHIVWDEELQEIQARLMGEIQVEILQSLIFSRFGVEVSFGEGKIVYKETIRNAAEGVGHFEPLRHYAEVQLLLREGERESGLVFYSACSEDILAKNWQRLILTHLKEKTHRGVLIGSPITDMEIILLAGKAHNKHTEGGDFREATYRAVRQGLMEAESVLLEPYYSFWLEIPEHLVGRAMTDIDKMHGVCKLSEAERGRAVITGEAPVATMRNYQKDVIAYSRGEGTLVCTLKGYDICHNPEEVIERVGYDPERDMRNSSSSVFCAHGSGFFVPWHEVKKHMHLTEYIKQGNLLRGMREQSSVEENSSYEVIPSYEGREEWIDVDEIDAILNRTYHSNQGKKTSWKKSSVKRVSSAREDYYKNMGGSSGIKVKEKKEEYLLVDGYNIIFAWEDLSILAKENMDSAKLKLAEELSNYQGIKNCRIILVFDAYRVQGHQEETIEYQNIHIVYTKEAQTADQYIERFAHVNKGKYHITVATSDGLQQIIIRGAGCSLLSARDLKIEMEESNQNTLLKYQEKQDITKRRLLDQIPLDVMNNLKKEF